MKHIYILFSHLKVRGLICKKAIKDNNISLDDQMNLDDQINSVRKNLCSESVMTKVSTN